MPSLFEEQLWEVNCIDVIEYVRCNNGKAVALLGIGTYKNETYVVTMQKEAFVPVVGLRYCSLLFLTSKAKLQNNGAIGFDSTFSLY